MTNDRTKPQPPGLRPGELWWNWFGEFYFTPARLARPREENDVVEAVRYAAHEGMPVRVSARGHSNPQMVPTPGIQVDFAEMDRIISVDRDKFQVTVQPGITVGSLSRQLRDYGMSLNNQGDIDTQTIVGAIATGTHGAGVTLPAISSQMIAARVVTASGEILDLSEKKDGDLFRAFRCSLGLLGVTISVTLQAVPSYNIHKRSWNADSDACIADLHGLLERHRTFWFFWLPTQASADFYVLPPDIPDQTSRGHDICHMRSYDAVPVDHPAPELGAGEVFDHSSVVYPNTYLPNFREIEYAVPFGRFEEAFEEIRHLRMTRYPDEHFPVECRPVLADDSMLSAYAGRDGYALSISGSLDASTWDLLKACDAILDRYDARPHWGKHHFMTAERLERIYPEYDAFRRFRRELDPKGMFLNQHLTPLFA
ncbi:MAG: FAD linked oxidase [Rhizobiales bacterium]|nr:FAD linked oxidase [Hyphomicrobiales bacterium]MBA70683.1 FAD linked oxidase [Hyphomicrobiales bacterium]|tara:strand:- start:1604 stop:2881 length:1278 start_codon:yes stop_codon:yes gene_type:complete